RNATMADGLIVGVGQAIATCPGISRSGMTICAGCYRGFDRRFAVRFAFLLSIPAVLGANILQIKDVVAAGGIDVNLLPAYLAGVIVAAVSGYFSIRLVRLVADKGKFGAFAYYCCAAGAVTVILSFLKFWDLLPWFKAAA
ncbi:MAG: undecaprenyl-diphosphate phosphatase, partial [Oscillospiraceae bacterium]|nr:undecaprenyl-diphosphate phosphatase [Oscillospiraceae bacterium]